MRSPGHAVKVRGRRSVGEVLRGGVAKRFGEGEQVFFSHECRTLREARRSCKVCTIDVENHCHPRAVLAMVLAADPL